MGSLSLFNYSPPGGGAVGLRPPPPPSGLRDTEKGTKKEAWGPKLASGCRMKPLQKLLGKGNKNNNSYNHYGLLLS